MAKAPKNDLLQGTLDLLILKTLAIAPQHGWGISQRLQQISHEVFRVNQGSLYPALHRLEEQGLVSSTWGVSDNNREAKYYRLTKAGQKRLAVETANWERTAAAVARVLSTATES
jgi:PadR family transcriptional regulator, regulatory protein PadR